MNKFLPYIVSFILIIGTMLTLIQLYASADNIQHPLMASIYYFITSLILIIFIINFRKETKKVFVIINNIIISIFTIHSIIFALICLYALEPQIGVQSFASAIFFFSGMLASSSLFFVKSQTIPVKS